MKAEEETLRLIGDHFRRARLAAGLTQEQVADLAGISRPRYRDIETGAAAARTTTFINIARALGLEMMLVPLAKLTQENSHSRSSRWSVSLTPNSRTGIPLLDV